MKNFIGIDLGTTNSVIASYDGSQTRIWKSPGQNDVTPSAIYIDKRGNKYFGTRAYDSAPQNPDNAATLFKRLMGTSTPVNLSAVNITLTPEGCSSEILKVLFGYLDEDIRNDPDVGTVITVPAAFNQMQKEATLRAAEIAGIGKVALMQEPVAAVMSVMRTRITNGIFLIYDLGGGTLDVAIAESMNSRVNLLAHGGIAMCGGRDFDKILVNNIVRPWLMENFGIPEDFVVNPNFKALYRLAIWAAERAKIELSSREDTVITLSETETRARDNNGNEIYLEVPLNRDDFNRLAEEQILDSIDSARETINKAGLAPHDFERIVFIGGPTNYKPLRDMVSRELGIPGSFDVNPMTAVAEGASIFAESIDWNTQERTRKNTRGQISSGGQLPVSFNFIARTPDIKAKIAIQLTDHAKSSFEFQIDSLDTGWSSGRLPLKHGEIVEVRLNNYGDNVFKVFVYDSNGSPINVEQNKIIITRTAATIDAIPASHSIGVAVLEKLGGSSVLEYLVHAGDTLPQKGKKTFKAGQLIKANSPDSLNFNLWEGEIEFPIAENRHIGAFKISGNDFDEGVIPTGAEIECAYEILDSGNINMIASVPCIGAVFHSNNKNFYSPQEGQIDYSDAVAQVVEKGNHMLERIDEISEVVDDPKLDKARQKTESVIYLDSENSEPEETKKADDNVQEARKLLAQVRKEHLKEIRQIDLDKVKTFFDNYVRKDAKPSEASSFDNLARTAQRAIERNENDFERHVDELRTKSFDILWCQDWYVVDLFKIWASSPHQFVDKNQFTELVKLGTQYMQSDDIEKLRSIVARLSMIRIGGISDDEISEVANTNIIRG